MGNQLLLPDTILSCMVVCQCQICDGFLLHACNVEFHWLCCGRPLTSWCFEPCDVGEWFNGAGNHPDLLQTEHVKNGSASQAIRHPHLLPNVWWAGISRIMCSYLFAVASF